MSTTTPQTTSTHKLDPQAWPIHVELGVIQEALRVQGEQIGAFDQFAEDQGDDAVRLRAIANVARSFADLADALAVDAKPPHAVDGTACRRWLAEVAEAKEAVTVRRATRDAATEATS